jgi:uncharacterized protein YbjT (DUF2867 family)
MILVTGATGRLGNKIVRLLRAARFEVRCLVRPGSEYYWLNDTGANYFFSDLRDPAGLKRALKGVDLVIHAANVRVESTDNHHGNVTHEGTLNLIAAAKHHKIKRLVMVSCLGVELPTTCPAFTNLNRAEEALIGSGLPYSIVRCGPFVDEIADVARAIRDGQSPSRVGHRDTPIAPLARRDAALVALSALDHSAALGHVLSLVGPDRLTLGEALDQACAAAGQSPSYRLIDGVAAQALIRASRVAGRRWPHWFQRWMVLWGEDLTLDPKPLATTLGIPLTPFAQALSESLAEEDLSSDPEARDTKVVHRQFQATVYEPGEILWSDLPEGPLRADEP